MRDATATRTKKNTFKVTACLDVSDVDVVDASGKSVVSAGRPDAQRYTYTVQKAPEGFFVVEDLLKAQSCAA